MKNIGIVCNSNGLSYDNKDFVEKFNSKLYSLDILPTYSEFIYCKEYPFSGNPTERAQALMKMYLDSNISGIFDISGGDIANQILDYLDYDIIAKSNKRFWGYSDLTTVINAIYNKTGNYGVLFPVKNLVYNNISDLQQIFNISYKFINGRQMQGVIIGGNIRCLLKLAGTPYFPDVSDKILLLEAFSGTTAKISTYLAQLKQMGVFDKISGILLGTFTQMECDKCRPEVESMVIDVTEGKIPIAKTKNIGHGKDSGAIVIGKEYEFTDRGYLI